MMFSRTAIVVFLFALSACSPTPPSQQAQTAQQTPTTTPKKDKSIHVSEQGW